MFINQNPAELSPQESSEESRNPEFLESEDIRHLYEELKKTNEELKNKVNILQKENYDLKAKLSSTPAPVSFPQAAPPPPPPPPPPPMISNGNSVVDIIKERKSTPKKSNVEKSSQEDTAHSQLISEVLNFIKHGSLGRTKKRERSLTQPDLSADIEKYRQSRDASTIEQAVDKFKGLRTNRSGKGDILAKELDALKSSNKIESNPPRGTPLLLRRGSLGGLKLEHSAPIIIQETKEKATRKENEEEKVKDVESNESNEIKSEDNEAPGKEADFIGEKSHLHTDETVVVKNLQRRGSVSAIRARLEVSSLQGTPATSPKHSPTVSPSHSRSQSISKHEEEQIAAINFEEDRSSSAELRVLSRSSGVASSLLCERLTDLHLSPNKEQTNPERLSNTSEDEGYSMTTPHSPRIVITPVEQRDIDPFQAMAPEPATKQQQPPSEVQSQVLVVSMPISGDSKAKNQNAISQPKVSSARDKNRFWENAISNKSPSPNSGKRSPTLEKFQTAARSTIEANKALFNASSQKNTSSSVPSKRVTNFNKFRLN